MTVVSELCTPINGHAAAAAARSTGALAKATVAEDVVLGRPSTRPWPGPSAVTRSSRRSRCAPRTSRDIWVGVIRRMRAPTSTPRGPTPPRAVEINPRMLFERIFGRAGSAAQRQRRADRPQHPRLAARRRARTADRSGSARRGASASISRTCADRAAHPAPRSRPRHRR